MTVFLGVRVPKLRALVRKHRETPLRSVLALLKSAWHEERLCAVLLLAEIYRRGNEDARQSVYDAYLEHLEFVNNWDIVDASAHLIVGAHLYQRSRAPLYELAASTVVWERRVAMMATYFFIRREDFDDTLRLAEVLLTDPHDLIHKMSGWMLREVGNRDRQTLCNFLDRHCTSMPRTMLRYAIEKLPERKRRAYLDGTV